MEAGDRERFLAAIARLAAGLRSRVQAASAERYWEALRPFDLHRVVATMETLERTTRTFPAIADLLGALAGPRDKAKAKNRLPPDLQKEFPGAPKGCIGAPPGYVVRVRLEDQPNPWCQSDRLEDIRRFEIGEHGGYYGPEAGVWEWLDAGRTRKRQVVPGYSDYVRTGSLDPVAEY